MHFRKVQHHAADFPDGREEEREDIEAAIVRIAKEKKCVHVIQGGDALDSRDADPEEVRRLVSFLESLGAMMVSVLSGNHASRADGTAAEDFINELSDKDWRFVNEVTHNEAGVCYVPYTRRQQVGAQTDAEVVEKVLGLIDRQLVRAGRRKFKAIVIHHAIAGTVTASGQMTDMFREAVFPGNELLKRADRVFGAHIHEPQDDGNVHVIGSVMAHDVGELKPKRVIVWDDETGEVESVELPGRKMARLVDPSPEELREAKGKYDLVKVVVTDQKAYSAGDLEGVVVQEKPRRREKSEEVLDFSVPSLLEAYARERKVDREAIFRAWSRIS